MSVVSRIQAYLPIEFSVEQQYREDPNVCRTQLDYIDVRFKCVQCQEKIETLQEEFDILEYLRKPNIKSHLDKYEDEINCEVQQKKWLLNSLKDVLRVFQRSKFPMQIEKINRRMQFELKQVNQKLQITQQKRFHYHHMFPAGIAEVEGEIYHLTQVIERLRDSIDSLKIRPPFDCEFGPFEQSVDEAKKSLKESLLKKQKHQERIDKYVYFYASRAGQEKYEAEYANIKYHLISERIAFKKYRRLLLSQFASPA